MTRRIALVAALVTACVPAPDLPLAREPERSTTTGPPVATPPTTTTTTAPPTTTTTAPVEVVDMPPVLVAIAECESGGDPQARNPRSSAAGKFQFTTPTWASTEAGDGYSSADAAPEHIQDAAAVELYERAGTQPWAASRSCWN